MTRPKLPQCVQAMGCWCAAHAMGAPYTAPCNADEASARAEQTRARKRLEYLRQELQAERISYGELAELESLKGYIRPGDIELLEAAGVPEFPDDPTPYETASAPDPRDTMRDEQVEAMKYKR